MPARVGNHIAKRHHTLTKEVLDIAWKAQVRLCQRYRSMTARGKNGSHGCGPARSAHRE